MSDPNRPTPTEEDQRLAELEGEELIEVVRQTVTDLQQMLDRLRRYVGDDDE